MSFSAPLRPIYAPIRSQIPARRRSFVLGRFCGLYGAFPQPFNRLTECGAQCHRQYEAAIVPCLALTSFKAKTNVMGSNIAYVALHNAYGKLNRRRYP